MEKNVWITNDAVVAAILFLILYTVHKTAESTRKGAVYFYKIFPPILLCYFIPGLCNTLHVFSGENSAVYPFVSKYLLPVCLLLFTISLDVKVLKKLGWKAILVFLAGTFGVIIGGPIAVKIVQILHPETFFGTGQNALWRGLGTIAGSWIGGGVNQTALKEILQPSAYLFSQTVAVDVIVAELLMAGLLISVRYAPQIDNKLKADTQLVAQLREQVAEQPKAQVSSFDDFLAIFALGFICTGLAYFCADWLGPFFKSNFPASERFSLTSTFFWVVLIVTVLGFLLSFTKARELETVGASKIGSLILYILVASIGMQMDLFAIVDNPWLFLIGLIWIFIHLVCITLAARWLRAPFFLLAVGSQANIGGAASASIVAGAFHSSLVPIGVVFAVLGYAIGTYGGYLTAFLMQWVLS
jgi:uncharacterized membrane protein